MSLFSSTEYLNLRSLRLFLLAFLNHHFQLLFVDQPELKLHLDQLVLIGFLFGQFLLSVSIFQFVFLSLSFSLSNRFCRLLNLEVFLHLHTSQLNVVALSDLCVPEILDRLHFVILLYRKIQRHFVQIQRSFCLITVSYLLLGTLAFFVFDNLESEVCNWRGCQV